MPPKVAVVIPVFNRPETVAEAIKSVLAQTCEDFELVVVDDGSSDRTVDAIRAIRDSRIRLVRHRCNRGGAAARNTGIQRSSAPFVAFLDSDDTWMPMKLERQLELFERCGDDLALVYTGAARIDSDGSVSVDIPRRRSDLARILLTRNVIGETSVGIVRRSALEQVGGFDEALPAWQDIDLWLRLCERFRAEVVPEVLVSIRKGNGSGRISTDIEACIAAREQFRRKHREKLLAQGLLHEHLRETGWLCLRSGRDTGKARKYFLSSLLANPAAPLSYLLVLAACLPMSWLDFLARCKQSFASIRRGRQQLMTS
jgi:glycosyltransferase involved in cell wall biosynthesis